MPHQVQLGDLFLSFTGSIACISFEKFSHLKVITVFHVLSTVDPSLLFLLTFVFIVHI